MRVTEISFSSFRNLKDATIEPSEGINIICGENAQGKTNFLEAIWLFTGGRSFRGAKDKDLVRFGEHEAFLELKEKIYDREQRLKIEIKNGKRCVIINKVPQQTASAMVGQMCAVVFSPNHLDLIKGGPNVRRKFLDTAICQLQPLYTAQFLRYNHVLSQRNMLLRQLKKSKNLIDTLDIWEDKLVDLGSELILRREDYVKNLKKISAEFYSGLSASKESLFLQYKNSTAKENSLKKEQVKKDFKEALKNSREEDLALGFTTKGPHRDELEIRINEKSARQFSSQGQQRSAVLAIKLAETEIVRQTVGEDPIILLDDVLSELDAKRQSYLLKSIPQKQVFITCCEPELTSRLAAEKVFEVSDGAFL